jgi:hypothetical protein
MNERLLTGVIFFLLSYGTPVILQAQQTVIRPGKIWTDNRGRHIQAHGGGIIKVEEMYYWYGEERSAGLDSNLRYVSCYSSKDLVNWTFRGDVVKMSDPDQLGKKWILERPKVFYNEKTKKYVMYMHIDNSSYKVAEVAIAVSDSPDGDFRYVKRFRPLGHESRDN